MTTVREHYAQLMARYRRDVVETDLSSIDPKFQENIGKLLEELGKLWFHIENAGVFSKNEDLEEISSRSLTMLTIPYLIAETQQRVCGDKVKREDVLKATREAAQTFLRLMIQLNFVKEEEVEAGVRYVGSARDQRVALARKQIELEHAMKDAEGKLGYLKAKSKRLKALLESETGEDAAAENAEDLDNDEEDAIREFGMKKVEWCIGASFQLMQGTAQEVEMLAMMTDQMRQQAAAAYQEGMQAAERGENPSQRTTYTVLPGGQIATHTSLRMKFKDEVFQERNKPTMTLAEFADMEIAQMNQDMQNAADAKNAQEMEDALLGEEGVEERERLKQADWDNWRDENPPIGITTKGNYS